jgi:hypothetical protein
MPIETSWQDASQTLLLIRFVGRWTLNDFDANQRLSRRMIRVVTHPIVLLIDATDVYFPINVFPRFVEAAQKRDPQVQRVIIVATHPMISAFYNALTALLRDPYMLLVSTFEEAHEIARKTLEVVR